jgi:hypothetical protein
VQLVTTRAERDGVSPDVLRAVLQDDVSAMGDVAALGWVYARAVLARDSDVDRRREQIAARWGARAAMSVAFAVATVGVFPRLKYALGHGQACSQVRVGDGSVAVGPVFGKMPA